jgi:hypothetical protein
MFFAGRTHDHVACADFALGAALALHPAKAGGDDQPLAKRMRVPGSAGPGFEGNQGGGDPRRICRLEQWVDPHITGEIFRRTFGGGL